MLRTPAAKKVALAGLVPLGAIGLVLVWLLQQAQAGDCTVSVHPELSIDELIAVKKRFMAYREHPDDGMQLTGSELAMLLEDQAGTPVFLEIEGEAFRAEAALAKQADRCWPVRVSGRFRIDDSKVFVVPETLEIGAVDFTRMVEGVPVELLPEHMPNARSANLLQKTRAAAVVDGRLTVQLRDPNASIFTND